VIPWSLRRRRPDLSEGERNLLLQIDAGEFSDQDYLMLRRLEDLGVVEIPRQRTWRPHRINVTHLGRRVVVGIRGRLWVEENGTMGETT
jgi:hypothetical protein